MRQVTFDRDVQAAYIYVDVMAAHWPRETNPVIAKTVQISDGVLLDIDASGRVIGIELLDVKDLDGIEHEDITDKHLT
jgi:uncharacterized protein YuzE